MRPLTRWLLPCVMDEFALIARYLQPLALPLAGSLGLRDDAACLEIPAGEQLVVTADAMVEGVHFLGTEDASLIARKLLRVNLSDLAAKGAKPWCYFLTLMMPAERASEAWMSRFAEGLAQDQREFGMVLAGGDTSATRGPLCLSVTALGTVPQGRMLTRSGARPGDRICISGVLGEAAEGLRRLRAGASPDVSHAGPVARYLLPLPRLALGAALRGVASACMDISDGLAQDLGHLCRASGVGARVDAARAPRHAAGLEAALTGGDDYELLFTLPSAHAVPEGCTEIGVTTAGEEVVILSEAGEAMHLAQPGYRHFQ